jgi:hypothetical protein
MTNVEGRRPEGAPERSRKAGEGAASGVDGKVAKRFSVQRKMAVVARLLRGEPLELVAPETKPNKLRANTFAFSMLSLTARRYPAATFSTRSTRDIATVCGLTSMVISGAAQPMESTASVQMASYSGGYSCHTESPT